MGCAFQSDPRLDRRARENMRNAGRPIVGNIVSQLLVPTAFSSVIDYQCEFLEVVSNASRSRPYRGTPSATSTRLADSYSPRRLPVGARNRHPGDAHRL